MNDNVLYAMFSINCVLPIVVMVVFTMGFNRIVRMNNIRLYFGFGILVLFIGITLTFYSAYTAFGGFGPGTILFFGTFFMGLVTALVLFVLKSQKQEREYASVDARKYLTPLKLVLIIAQLSPMVGSLVYYDACDSLHRQQAKLLISAIESYYDNNNRYPDNLETLTPDYLLEIPTPLCLQPYYWIGQLDGSNLKDTYYMLNCGDKKLLAVHDTSLGWLTRYDFITQKWSASDFLDGYCAYLD